MTLHLVVVELSPPERRRDYPAQVEEFWRVIDGDGVTVKDLKEVLRSRRDYTYRNTLENMAVMTAVFEAADAAETARVEITS